MDKLTLVLLDLLRAIARSSAQHRDSMSIDQIATTAPSAATSSFWNLDATYERLLTPSEDPDDVRGGGRLVTAGPSAVSCPTDVFPEPWAVEVH